MSRSLVSPRTVVVGFVAALVVLAALGTVVGFGGVVASLAEAEPWSAAAALAAAAVWLCSWGVSLFVVLRTLGVSVSLPRSILVYASATFFNGLTPFAQLGGEALSAAVLTRSADVEYETGLAAVAAVDVVNLIPSPLFALFGVLALAATGTQFSEFGFAATTLLLASTAVAAVGAFAWYFRDDVGPTLVRLSVKAVAAVNRVTGRGRRIDPARLRHQVESFVGGLGHVFGQRRRLAVCLALSSLGWTALVVALWVSLRAVGYPVSVAVAAFVLPVGMLAIVMPLPGGVGGIEAALVGLLVAVGGVPVVHATAAVVLYRGVTYWIPLLFGGVVTAALAVEERRHEHIPSR